MLRWRPNPLRTWRRSIDGLGQNRLGFGEQAILSERAASGIVMAKHQQDAEEFLRRWPRTRSIQQELGYLRQLGLHVGYNPPGVNPSDTSALLRSAVKSGKVMVVIERAKTGFGGEREQVS